MTINEMYYLVMVCTAFAGLGLFLGRRAPGLSAVAKPRPREPHRKLEKLD